MAKADERVSAATCTDSHDGMSARAAIPIKGLAAYFSCTVQYLQNDT